MFQPIWFISTKITLYFQLYSSLSNVTCTTQRKDFACYLVFLPCEISLFDSTHVLNAFTHCLRYSIITVCQFLPCTNICAENFPHCLHTLNGSAVCVLSYPLQGSFVLKAFTHCWHTYYFSSSWVFSLIINCICWKLFHTTFTHRVSLQSLHVLDNKIVCQKLFHVAYMYKVFLQCGSFHVLNFLCWNFPHCLNT